MVHRFFRLVQKNVDNASPFSKLNILYNETLDNENREFASECGRLICNINNSNAKYNQLCEKEKNLAKFLNELWHQIFGATNEYLVKEGFVTTPDNIDGQGRYLRSLIISQN